MGRIDTDLGDPPDSATCDTTLYPSSSVQLPLDPRDVLWIGYQGTHIPPSSLAFQATDETHRAFPVNPSLAVEAIE